MGDVLTFITQIVLCRQGEAYLQSWKPRETTPHERRVYRAAMDLLQAKLLTMKLKTVAEAKGGQRLELHKWMKEHMRPE